jgi:hypothetical protein
MKAEEERFEDPAMTRKPDSGPCPKAERDVQTIPPSPLLWSLLDGFSHASWTKAVTRALVNTYRVRRKNSQTARLEADELSWG